jgi:hypothetical protein
MSKRRGPKQHDVLFECPRDTKDEEEGEKRVLMTFGPEIRRFWKYCIGRFIGKSNLLRKGGHQRTFVLGDYHDAFSNELLLFS